MSIAYPVTAHSPVSDGRSYQESASEEPRTEAGEPGPEQSEHAQGTTTGGTGERSDQDKQQDQRNNPDDDRQQPTDQQR